MANFNLADYATVAERLAQFWRDHPDGGIKSENLTTPADRERGQWVVKVSVYFNRADSIPAGEGHAYEVDGKGMANQTSALENAETSAAGRALAMAGYAMNKKNTALASREEMRKVSIPSNKPSEAPRRQFLAEAYQHSDQGNIEALRGVYRDAVAAGVDQETLKKIEALGKKKQA